MKEPLNGKPQESFKKQVDLLYETMKSENLEELEINDKGLHIRIKRKGQAGHQPVYDHNVPVQAAQARPQPAAAPCGDSVKSPITGVFYRSPSPSSPPFVKEGDTVEEGKTLCIVEAMKVMNEVKAESAARILKIAVENGKPVSAGQDIFIVEKL